MTTNASFLVKIYEQAEAIETWFNAQWEKTPPPFYCSVDLRYSNAKLSPVDTNLFPAGFNLLSPERHALCAEAIKAYLKTIHCDVQRILLIPENHTRNLHYLENVATIAELIEQAGVEVRIGTLIEEIKAPKKISLPSGQEITLHPLQKQNHHLYAGSFDPELILLNNDLTSGIPALLENLDQPIFPPLKVGWSTRHKSQHFQHYQAVAEEFAELVNIDPWLIFPLFQYCLDVSLLSHEGEDCIELKAKSLFDTIQEKYDQHGISKPPFLMIKSDSGTYGIGVMTLKSPENIHHLNRKERAKMASGKGGVEIHRVLIQEGIYTSEFELDSTGAAEAVIYMIGKKTVGGFYRLHSERQSDENLNSPGMYFDYTRFETLSEMDKPRFYAYCTVAKLAMLAAAREMHEGL